MCQRKFTFLLIRGSYTLNGIVANLFTESRRDNKKNSNLQAGENVERPILY